jgi:GH35 family endo-1,4-beta-xylanase
MKLSRRDFLKLSGALLGEEALRGFSPGLLRVRAEADEFESLLNTEIRTYADSMGYSADEVARRIEQRYLADTFNQQFAAIVDRDSSMPLLVTNDNHEWQPACLKELGRHGDIHVGQLVESQIEYPILKSEFNKGLLTSSWSGNFTDDHIYTPEYDEHAYAKGHWMGIENFCFMHLIYPHSWIMPEWIRDGIYAGTLKAEEIQTIVENYITAVMTHFKDRIKDYVVVNEPYRARWWDELLRTGLPDYIEVAFRAARRADPGARLILNADDNFFRRGVNTQHIIDIAQRLKSNGLIDTVGVQMHINQTTPGLDYDPQDVADTIRRYADIGVSVAITEFDVDMSTYKKREYQQAQTDGERQQIQLARFHKQAEVYKTVIGAALSAGVTSIGFWGDRDNTSWKVTDDEASLLSDPCMWDENGKPKPAYYAVRKLLFAHVATDITKRIGAHRR